MPKPPVNSNTHNSSPTTTSKGQKNQTKPETALKPNTPDHISSIHPFKVRDPILKAPIHPIKVEDFAFKVHYCLPKTKSRRLALLCQFRDFLDRGCKSTPLLL